MNIIEVSDLVKDYKDVKAVKSIGFSVEEGSFFAFLGVNGAGKSTTINILCTVIEKTAGTVRIGGYDLDTDRNKIKGLIGIVFQNSVLDKQLTVRENLISRAAYYGLGKKEIKARIEELKEIFELDEIMNRRYGQLSGGQRRRVDIARALINRPKILFLDEPTTGLHFYDVEKLLKAFDVLLSKGHTVIVVEHNLDVIKAADWVIDLGPEAGDAGGEVVFSGRPEDLIAEGSTYTAEYLRKVGN